MINTEIRVLGVVATYKVPDTVAEYDTLAGKEGATLENAVKQELYHGSFADIRAKVADLLIEEGHERLALETEIRKSTDEEGNEVEENVVTKWETESTFFNRICGVLKVEASHFSELCQKAADLVPFDPSKKERSAKAKKVGKTHMKAAEGIAEAGALERVAENLAEKLGITIDVSDPDTALENLARAIGLNEAADKKDLAASYLNM